MQINMELQAKTISRAARKYPPVYFATIEKAADFPDTAMHERFKNNQSINKYFLNCKLQ